MQSHPTKENNAPTLVQLLEKASTDLTMLVVDLDTFHTNFAYIHSDRTVWQPMLEALADRSDDLLAELESLKHEVSSRNKNIKNQWFKLLASAHTCNTKILYYFNVSLQADKLPDENKKAIKSTLRSIQSNEFNCKNDDWCQQDVYFLFELQTTLTQNLPERIYLIALLEQLIEMSSKNFLRMRMFGSIINLTSIDPTLLCSKLAQYAGNLESTVEKINSQSSILAAENNLSLHGKVQQANTNMLAYEFLYLHRYFQYIKNNRDSCIQFANLGEEFHSGDLSHILPVPEKITEPELKSLLENEAVLRIRYYMPALNLIKSIDFNSMEHHHATKELLSALIEHARAYAISTRNVFSELLYNYNHKTLKLTPNLAKILSERVALFNGIIKEWEKIYQDFCGGR